VTVTATRSAGRGGDLDACHRAAGARDRVSAGKDSVVSAYVGASGFSYPSWKPGFYPADAKPDEFLRRYAERLPSVELNTTGYRLPAETSCQRWAEQTPTHFRFAVKLPGHFARRLGTFEERVSVLGERLGVVRPPVQKALDKLLAIPVDIEPRFTTAAELLK
jgi:hypothetical protein